jgi:hypothetical protein
MQLFEGGNSGKRLARRSGRRLAYNIKIYSTFEDGKSA